MPVNKNFNYYVGDRLSFEAHPRHRNGNPYDLTGFEARFVVSNEKSLEPEWSIDCDIDIDVDNAILTCVISPEQGMALTEHKTYYYDIEIKAIVEGENHTYTLMEGEIRPIIGVFPAVGP